MNEEQKQVAMAEWKLCYEIVSRHEQRIHNIHNWMFALVTGVTILLLKNQPIITSCEYVLIVFMLAVLVFSLDIFLRVPISHAIRRTREIEKALKGDSTYEGPVLSCELGTGPTCDVLKGLLKRPRIWSPYVVLVLFVVVVAYVAR